MIPVGPTLYDRVGGGPGLRTVVEAFYDVIETDPRFTDLHRQHQAGRGTAHARGAQFDFLSGVLGGPRLYAGGQGLRAMHGHLTIDASLRDLWLAAMGAAAERAGLEPDAAAALLQRLAMAAEMVVNRP